MMSFEEQVSLFLDVMYIKMMNWNAQLLSGKIAIWEYLGLSPKDYLEFCAAPEKWAASFLLKNQ